MAGPSTSLATLRPDIAASFMQFDLEASRAGFIGLQVAPVFESALAADSPGKLKLAALLREEETRRQGGSYGRGKWEFDSYSFTTKEHGWEEPVDDRQRNLYRNYFDLEVIAAQRARDVVIRNHERRVKALMASTYTAAAGTAWTTWSSSSPVTNVEVGSETFRARTGYYPNAIVMTMKAFRNCRNTAQVIDRVAAQGSGEKILAENINREMLARVFDLKYVLVAGGQRNSANEKQTPVLASIWDDTKAYLIRVPETNDVQEPHFARTFHWAADGSQIGGVMETYRDETVRGDIVRCRMDTDEVVMYAEMCQEITGVTA